MRTERLKFSNHKGEKLAALFDLPLGKPNAFALFAHCFTCGKDNLAAKRISEGLAMCGIGVLRIRVLQRDGGKAFTAADYLNGRRDLVR